jgi:hypothetical protein
VALMERLSTDRSIAPLVAQFVPLKIETDNPASWSAWSRKYRPEGRGIPIIFVVRADGQKLYGKSGSLSGPALPQLMQTMLSKSGRILSDQQIVSLEGAVSEAKKAKEAGDISATIRALMPINKVGPLGNLGSAAASAIEVDQLVKQLTDEGTASLDAAVKKLTESQDSTEAAIEYVTVKGNYAQLATMKTPLIEAGRTLAKRSELSDVLRQAEAFNRARTEAREVRTKKKGVDTLERLASQTANSEIATLALAELRELLGDDYQPGTSPTPKPATASRTWSDVSGKFRIEAVFKGVMDGKVVLQKKDGLFIKVPLEQLSEKDRKFIAENE